MVSWPKSLKKAAEKTKAVVSDAGKIGVKGVESTAAAIGFAYSEAKGAVKYGVDTAKEVIEAPFKAAESVASSVSNVIIASIAGSVILIVALGVGIFYAVKS